MGSSRYIYMMRVHFLVIPFSITKKRQQERKSRCLHGCRPTSGHNPTMGPSSRISRAEPAEIKLILIHRWRYLRPCHEDMTSCLRGICSPTYRHNNIAKSSSSLRGKNKETASVCLTLGQNLIKRPHEAQRQELH